MSQENSDRSFQFIFVASDLEVSEPTGCEVTELHEEKPNADAQIEEKIDPPTAIIVDRNEQ